MKKVSFKEAAAHVLSQVRRFLAREPDDDSGATEKNVSHSILEAVEQGYDDVNGYQNHIKKYVGQFVGQNATREQISQAYKDNSKFRAAIAQIGQEWGWHHWLSRSYFGKTVKQLDAKSAEKWNKIAFSAYWTGFFVGFHSTWGMDRKSVQDARNEVLKQYPQLQG